MGLAPSHPRRAIVAIGLLLACSEPSGEFECDPVPGYGGFLLAPLDLALNYATLPADPRRVPLAPATLERLDAAFVELPRVGIVELSAAIVTDDGQLWSSGSDRRFWWGSIGKTFTAMLILELQAQAKLDLTTPVNTWVAAIPQPNTITIDELLTHTSGLSNQMGNKREPEKYRTPEQLLARGVATKPGPCARGDWQYSNPGYLLLGLIIEAVEQRPYHEVMNETLLARLGPTSLAAIGPGPPPADVVPPVGDPPPSITTPFAAATIVGSALDMAIAWKQFLAGNLISKADVESMFATLYSMGDHGRLYGRGIMVAFTGTGDLLICHTGSIKGAKAFVAWSWQHRAVIAIAFTGEGDQWKLADALFAALGPGSAR